METAGDNLENELQVHRGFQVIRQGAAFTRLARRDIRPAVLRPVIERQLINPARFNGLPKAHVPTRLFRNQSTHYLARKGEHADYQPRD